MFALLTKLLFVYFEPMEQVNDSEKWFEKYRSRLFLAGLLLLLAVVGWFLWGWYWQANAVKEIIAIQESFQGDEAKSWSPEQRKSLQLRLGYLQKNLDENHKNSLRQQNSKTGLVRVEKEFDRILSLPRNEMVKELDRMINDSENARQAREKRNAELVAKGKAPPPKGQGLKLDNKGISDLLDQTTPELRAKFHLLIAQINKRRQERNLPPWHPFSDD